MDNTPNQPESTPGPQNSVEPSPASKPRPRGTSKGLIVAVCVVAVLLIFSVAFMVAHSKGNGNNSKPPVTTATSAAPNGKDLASILSKRMKTPAGWTFESGGNTGADNLNGLGPPIPLAQCSYIGGFNAIGVIAGLRTELSYAADTYTQIAPSGSLQGLPTGTLSVALSEFNSGGAAAAFPTIRGWLNACPAWEDPDLSINYASSVSPITGLGDQAIEIHATPQNPSGYTTEILIVQTSPTKLIVIASTIQAQGTPIDLSTVAIPLIQSFK